MLMLRSDLGAAPWDVLHQGIHRHTGIAIGTVIILVGALLVLAVAPFGTRPGIGTVMNALLIGVSVDLTMALTGHVESLPARVAMLAAGIVAFGIGSGVYIGTGLGAGPRDSLMTTLAARGWSVRLARTVIEVLAVGLGLLLGGTVGIGTLAFALTIGPIIQWALPRLTMEPATTPRDPAVVGVLPITRTRR